MGRGPRAVRRGRRSPERRRDFCSRSDWTAHPITPDLDTPTEEPLPVALLRRDLHPQQVRRLGPAVRHRARRVRGRDQRRRVGDRRPRARLDAATAPAAVPDLRRHRLLATGTTRSARRRPTAGTAAGSASTVATRNIYGDRPALLAQLEITPRRRHGQTDRAPTNAGVPRPARSLRPSIYDGETYDARLDRRGWSTPGFDDSDWSAVTDAVAARADSGRTDRPAGPAHRGRGAGRGHHARRPGRPCSTSGRTWSAGCAIRVAGPAGHDGHPAARRGARGRRARHPPAAAAAATDRYILRGDGSRPWEPRSPSTASATPRSTAGRVSSTRPTSTPSSCTPTWSAPAGSTCSRRAGQPAARERRVGHARQLPRHPDRLPAARRAPRLDRRHPGLRPDRRFLYDCSGSSALARGPGRRADRRRHGPALVRARRRRPASSGALRRAAVG